VPSDFSVQGKDKNLSQRHLAAMKIDENLRVKPLSLEYPAVFELIRP
jgi:hypothetical protein